MRLKTLTLALGLGTALTSGALAADPESCKTVRIGLVDWTDILATTAATSHVLSALGYAPEETSLAVPVVYTSLENKQLDVFLGNWMPSMAAESQPFVDRGTVETIATNLEGAGYGLVVPTYAAEAGVTDLKNVGENADKFDRKIYGIEPGNDGNRIVLEMIADPANGLTGFELVESSEAGMISQAERAIRGKEWIAFLGWTPHPVMGAMDITYLTGMGDTGFGAATVHTNVRKGYVTECPNVGKFFTNLVFTLQMENEIMGAILNDGADPADAALAWLKANPAAIEPWLAGVTAFDGSDGLAAVKAGLGL